MNSLSFTQFIYTFFFFVKFYLCILYIYIFQDDVIFAAAKMYFYFPFMSKSCINVGLMQLFNLLVPNILLYFISGNSVSTSNKVFNVNEFMMMKYN